MGLTDDDIRREAEAYYRRNKGRDLGDADPVMRAIDDLPVTRVLEIGSGDGARLRRIAQATGAKVEGLEASRSAVNAARERYVPTTCGVAPKHLVVFAEGSYDVVIVGFMAYLLDRSQVFRLAAEVDRLTAPGGHVIVRDFLYPWPLTKSYVHDDAMRVYKGDPSAPWTWDPGYTLVRRIQEVGGKPEEWVTVDVIRKHGWPSC